ncbi:MAG: DUF928 domain-containing protein [Oscillatoriophycideae cyanobacterium NC_groundwater_1537_Pr4_S-0.65um_50_18]|nr:DUF928 domain-containing protein [Oscillatoriophycideae cyanobacterium NC_groundwater_1537_Pr4_S-0.65um_50_18]
MSLAAFLPYSFVILSLAIAPFSARASALLPESSPYDLPLSHVYFLSASPADFAGTNRPPSRISGGSRGPCLDQLIAIVPGTGAVDPAATCSTESRSVLALTLSEFPSFWVYVPQLSPDRSSAQPTAELVILDDRQQPIQTERITLPAESGIISVTLRRSLPVNQPYRWIFSVWLNPHSPSQNPKVEGLIQRIQPDITLRHQLAEATSEADRLALYVEHNLWHDRLAALAAIAATPQVPESSWSNLLDSVGLGAIADEPILNCCGSVNATE